MVSVSLHTALSGIRAARVGMDTAAHNVANANTPGFTRQRVDLSTSYPYLSPNGPMGTGVTVDDITRMRDSFLDARLRSDMGQNGKLDVRADLLARAEAVLGEPENGLTGELTELWASFEELALRPEDTATRRQVLSALESLTARVRSVAGGLEILEKDTINSLDLAVKEVNALFEQAADLNGRILEARGTGGAPNDLLDARDRVLDDLSRRIGATVTLEDSGSVRISVSGLAVVSGTRATPLAFDVDTNEIRHPAGVAVTPGGEVAGLQTSLTEDLPGLRDGLDAFVDDLVTQLNATHASGYVSENVNGGPLLGVTAGAEALTLQVLITDPGQLAAAEGPSAAPHDGDNATKLADLRTGTLDGRLRSFVTEHAANVEATGRAARAQQQLTAAAGTARD
ncbi:MAG: flagellar hook-associated protein FlgK, partial [Nitriliruptor sp.]